MRENELIIAAIDQASKVGGRAALATVVSVRGSAYRREGAKMLIDEAGCITGTISGGCLEPDVAEVAKQVIESGQPILKIYNLDEDLVWGLGLGCPGTVKIYIEPIVMKKADAPFQAWLTNINEKKECVLATILPTDEASPSEGEGRLFLFKNDHSLGDLGNDALNSQVKAIAEKKMKEINPKSETRSFVLFDGKEVFIDVYIPPSEIMIFGAGHDAVPVSKHAVSLGFKTIIIDQREAFNNEKIPRNNKASYWNI